MTPKKQRRSSGDAARENIDFTDQDGLKSIALTHWYHETRKKAVQLIEDQDVLKRVALHDASQSVREEAVGKISDVEFVKKYIHDPRWTMRMAVVCNKLFTDQRTFERLADDDPHLGVRYQSIDRLDMPHLGRYSRWGNKKPQVEYAKHRLRVLSRKP